MRAYNQWVLTLDPLGPLSLRPGYALKILPWMLHFWRATDKARYEAAVEAQASLMQLSRAALERQIAHVSGEPLMRREGQLQLYEGAKAFAAAQESWAQRRRHGVRFEMLESPGAIAELQPGLSRRFTHAGFTPDWMNTVDPARWTAHLAEAFVKAGGQIEIAEVRGIVPHVSDVALETSAGTRQAAQVVVAAGAWSHHIAHLLGERIPLETERGYNTTYPTASFDVRMHLTFSDHGFVVSRIGDGLRVGGAVELGGLKLPPNFSRAETLVQKTAEFLPGFDPKGGTQWMGFRPSLPDSLPVIGRSRRSDLVIYAFGHGHLGLTQSAGTAEIVADLVARRPTAISLAPYNPERFA